MKVLKKGEPKELWSKEIICHGCKALLLVEESDLFRNTVDNAEYGTAYNRESKEYYAAFVCPECRAVNNMLRTSCPIPPFTLKERNE